MTSAYDQNTVDLFLAGYQLALTVPERREVVQQLTAQGWSITEIAERTQVTKRQVNRDRAAWTPQPTDSDTVPIRPYTGQFDDKAIRAAAARFIGAIHELDNGWELTATMPPDDIRVLAIVCAAAVDPNKPINELLAWVDRLTANLPATA